MTRPSGWLICVLVVGTVAAAMGSRQSLKAEPMTVPSVIRPGVCIEPVMSVETYVYTNTEHTISLHRMKIDAVEGQWLRFSGGQGKGGRLKEGWLSVDKVLQFQVVPCE